MQSHPLLPAELQARYRAEGLWSDDTFFSLLETSAAAAADRPLYLEPEVRTYGEATAAARALAQHLVASGVKPGDGVVTPLVNGLPAAVVSAAVAGAGGRLAPLPSRAHPAQAISLAATLEAPVLIVSGEVLARGEWDAGVLDRIRRESPSVRLILLADAGAAPDWARERLPTLESAVAANAAAELPPVDAGAIALLLSTGGTTGPAKVVMHTYAGPVFAAREYARIARLTAEDRVVQVGPFGHASGTIFTLYPPVMAGAAVVPLVGWDPVAFASAVESAEATWTHLSGTHVHDLLALDPVHDAKLRSLRGISAGSGSDQLFREAERRFGFQIQRIYGLTECLGNSLVPAGAPDDRRLHCDGRGFDGIEYRVVSPGTDDPLPPGTPGEMFVRGPSLFAGYLGRPEATAEVVRDDGFLATGDLMTCDEQGYIKYVRRLKDVIRRGGINIDPLALERSLLTHPEVHDVAVVGVPDGRLGERAAAVVVPTRGAKPELADLTGFLAEREVPLGSRPELLYLVDALPLTEYGKHDKNAIRRLVAQLIAR